MLQSSQIRTSRESDSHDQSLTLASLCLFSLLLYSQWFDSYITQKIANPKKIFGTTCRFCPLLRITGPNDEHFCEGMQLESIKRHSNDAFDRFTLSSPEAVLDFMGWKVSDLLEEDDSKYQLVPVDELVESLQNETWNQFFQQPGMEELRSLAASQSVIAPKTRDYVVSSKLLWTWIARTSLSTSVELSQEDVCATHNNLDAGSNAFDLYNLLRKKLRSGAPTELFLHKCNGDHCDWRGVRGTQTASHTDKPISMHTKRIYPLSQVSGPGPLPRPAPPASHPKGFGTEFISIGSRFVDYPSIVKEALVESQLFSKRHPFEPIVMAGSGISFDDAAFSPPSTSSPPISRSETRGMFYLEDLCKVPLIQELFKSFATTLTNRQVLSMWGRNAEAGQGISEEVREKGFKNDCLLFHNFIKDNLNHANRSIGPFQSIIRLQAPRALNESSSAYQSRLLQASKLLDRLKIPGKRLTIQLLARLETGLEADAQVDVSARVEELEERLKKEYNDGYQKVHGRDYGRRIKKPRISGDSGTDLNSPIKEASNAKAKGKAKATGPLSKSKPSSSSARPTPSTARRLNASRVKSRSDSPNSPTPPQASIDSPGPSRSQSFTPPTSVAFDSAASSSKPLHHTSPIPLPSSSSSAPKRPATAHPVVNSQSSDHESASDPSKDFYGSDLCDADYYRHQFYSGGYHKSRARFEPYHGSDPDSDEGGSDYDDEEMDWEGCDDHSKGEEFEEYDENDDDARMAEFRGYPEPFDPDGLYQHRVL